ncbi:MAG: hypothetical protein QM296_01145 [Bacillota bacterium]|nr:hypothetical protein [Bacillota bacterium]
MLLSIPLITGTPASVIKSFAGDLFWVFSINAGILAGVGFYKLVFYIETKGTTADTWAGAARIERNTRLKGTRLKGTRHRNSHMLLGPMPLNPSGLSMWSPDFGLSVCMVLGARKADTAASEAAVSARKMLCLIEIKA